MFRFASRAGHFRAAATAPANSTVTRSRRISPFHSRAASAVLATAAMTAAMAASAGPASARPVASPAAQPAAAAATCGFGRYWIGSTPMAKYVHCGTTTVRIHVDMSGGGSGNDLHLCVPPGTTNLGIGAYVLNAYYIGGAGCAIGRGPHTPH